MLEAARGLCRVDEARLHNGLQGAYVRERGLILLDAGLTCVQRRCVLAHEISHARHDDAGCRCDKWAERRADMEAAAMLINPLEYSYAESVYEGNMVGMARELDVLPWVIHAYSERLNDDPHLIVQ